MGEFILKVFITIICFAVAYFMPYLSEYYTPYGVDPSEGSSAPWVVAVVFTVIIWTRKGGKT
jgi:hypothetical protein